MARARVFSAHCEDSFLGERRAPGIPTLQPRLTEGRQVRRPISAVRASSSDALPLLLLPDLGVPEEDGQNSGDSNAAQRGGL